MVWRQGKQGGGRHAHGYLKGQVYFEESAAAGMERTGQEDTIEIVVSVMRMRRDTRIFKDI